MHKINEKLNQLSRRVVAGAPVKVMIFGFGSVGSYLADYLLSQHDMPIELHVCGRSAEKNALDINILRLANIIRGNSRHLVRFYTVDLNDVGGIAEILQMVVPDFIVNSSRVYSGIKYGSISWARIRAYGLWSPLSVKYIRNIMQAHDRVDCRAIVINTSYSDGVNAWLKSAGLSAPDFGSGNVNHLIPRLKISAAELSGIVDYDAIEVTLATGHFHDVVISKEGHVEGVPPLIDLRYAGKKLEVDPVSLYKKCAIPIPVDARRNMMNASSNFEIIWKVFKAAKDNVAYVIHSPGVAGYIGGYPVRVDFRKSTPDDKRITFVEDYYSLESMQAHNRQSMALDGVEDISGGALVYTSDLIEKVKRSFGVSLPGRVEFGTIEDVSAYIVENIISPSLKKT